MPLTGVRGEASNWYCFYTKQHQEEIAAQSLAAFCDGQSVLLPRVKIIQETKYVPRVVIQPLFPRYIFGLTAGWRIPEICREQWKTRGIAGVVRFDGVPATVPDWAIEDLENRMRESGDVIDLTGLKPGQKVRVINPKLSIYNHEAIYECSRGEDRISVLLYILNQQVSYPLERKDVVACL